MSDEGQVEELKQLVRRNIELSTETNKLVHSMHRHERWAAIFRVIKILILVALAGGLYLFFAPYIEQIRSLYESAVNLIPGR